MVQIWSQSLIGLLFFIISLGIFFISSASFSNRVYKFFVLFIRLSTIITISVSLMASTKLFQSYSFSEYYDTIGINSVIDFKKELK